MWYNIHNSNYPASGTVLPYKCLHAVLPGCLIGDTDSCTQGTNIMILCPLETHRYTIITVQQLYSNNHCIPPAYIILVIPIFDIVLFGVRNHGFVTSIIVVNSARSLNLIIMQVEGIIINCGARVGLYGAAYGEGGPTSTVLT